MTIAVPPDLGIGLEDTVRLIAQRAEVSEYAILRSLKTFKIGVKLNYESVDEREEISAKEFLYKPLSEEEKFIVRITQEDMPLVERPYLEYAKRLSMEEDRLLEKLREFKDRGILRRISAIIYHKKVGFTANAMSVWRVEGDRLVQVGNYLASFRSVSHCYQRSGWHYNLFAMIHGKSTEEIKALTKRISEELEISDYALLFSIREFKKERIKYFSEDFKGWYEKSGLGIHCL